MYNAWLQKISAIMTSKPALWCIVCQNTKQDICDQKIFSKEWIEGMFNQTASNIPSMKLLTLHKCYYSHAVQIRG